MPISTYMDADPHAIAASIPLGRTKPNISRASSDGKGDERKHENAREEAELVGRARAGDKDAFARLYRTHYASVFRVAQFSIGDGAEDVAAETFVRAWKALPRCRDKGVPFIAWLYGIARHVATDELRRRQRNHPASDIPERATSEDHDDRLDLAAALRDLPHDQARIIEMKYLLGLTNPEVAAALGKSIGAVNAQQWRALKALKKVMSR